MIFFSGFRDLLRGQSVREHEFWPPAATFLPQGAKYKLKCQSSLRVLVGSCELPVKRLRTWNREIMFLGLLLGISECLGFCCERLSQHEIPGFLTHGEKWHTNIYNWCHFQKGQWNSWCCSWKIKRLKRIKWVGLLVYSLHGWLVKICLAAGDLHVNPSG